MSFHTLKLEQKSCVTAIKEKEWKIEFNFRNTETFVETGTLFVHLINIETT